MELQPRPFEIVLEGLGTVTPIATVTVRSQVDGPLLSVAFQEGARVKRGDVLAQIDPRPFRIKLAQARAATQRDQATLQNAKLDLDRYKSLSEQKLIARQQLDSQQSMVDQLSASVAADEANTDEAQLQLDYTRIVSPIDGVAGIRQVDPGNLVHAADSSGIVVLTQLDPIAVVFTLPQDQLTQLSAAMASGSPKVEIWSRDGEEHLSNGTLQVIDNQINVQTASIRLKARFDNAEHKLWPNQFVRARVTVSHEDAALVLPAVAIQHGPQGAYVYVVSKDKNIAELRPVHIALLQGEDVVLGSGVKQGELVVTQGQAQVKPKSPVNPVTGDEKERGTSAGEGAGADKRRERAGAAGAAGAR
jgi:multidrug efflux system membrane fusion protein